MGKFFVFVNYNLNRNNLFALLSSSVDALAKGQREKGHAYYTRKMLPITGRESSSLIIFFVFETPI